MRRLVLSFLLALGLVLPASAGNQFQGQSALITQPPVTFPEYTVDSSAYTTATSDLGGTSQFPYFLMNPVSSIRLVYTNYADPTNGESLTNVGTLTVKAVVAIANTSSTWTFYPSALSGGVTWGGNQSVNIPPGGEVVSDPIPFQFPQGTFFYVRTYANVATAGTLLAVGPTINDVLLPGASNPALPTGMASFPTDVSNNSGDNYLQHTSYSSSNTAGADTRYTNGLSTTWLRSTNSYSYGPAEVEGNVAPTPGYGASATTPPVNSNISNVCNIGDSIFDGYGDGHNNWSWIMRAEFTNATDFERLSRPNELGSGFLTATGHFNRIQQAESCTHAIIEYGTNDLAGGATAAAVEATNLAIAGLLIANGIPASKIYITTILPRVTGTSPYCPQTNQTIPSYNAARNTYNADLRAGTSPIFSLIPKANMIDPAAYVESDASNTVPGGLTSPNTAGYWYCGVGDATPYTADGVHPSSLGHSTIATAQWTYDARTFGQMFAPPTLPGIAPAPLPQFFNNP
jgi:lysophospholipase L1-like esterase